MPIRVKICGITQSSQAQAIVQLGVTALGFICVPQSPRYVTPEQIRAIVEGLVTEPVGFAPEQLTAAWIDRVGVFVDTPLEEIQRIIAIAQLNGVQLHGSESPQFCRELRAAMPEVMIIKAFRVRTQETLAEAIAYQTLVDALLLDAYNPRAIHPGLYGGTGHTLAWEQLQQFRPDCPWFLAGGITPDNVQEALSLVQPDGIDVSSGVERVPGQKDPEKVAALVARLAQLPQNLSSVELSH